MCRSGAVQAAQHEVEPQLELGSHVDAAAEVVGNGQKLLLGAGPHKITTNRYALGRGGAKPAQLGARQAPPALLAACRMRARR